MKILIIKLAAVGDVLRTTSILAGLRERYSSLNIDWITATAAKDVLLYNSLIDNLWVWEGLPELERYDLVICLEDDIEAVKLASEIKSSKIIGSYLEAGKITYTPSAWFDMSLISKYGIEKANELKKKNKKTFQQHMAELLGIKMSAYIFSLADEEIEYGKKVIKNLGLSKKDKVVGVNTGAGKRWPQKSWGIEQTIEFCKKLYKELGVVPLLLGGEEEKERNELIAKESGALDSGRHSLRSFASIINQCSAIVCSDSLALHLAVALRKKIAVFFGPTSPAEIELYGLGVKLFPKMDCLVCYKKKCDLKPNCMELLSIEEVFTATKTLLPAHN